MNPTSPLAITRAIACFAFGVIATLLPSRMLAQTGPEWSQGDVGAVGAAGSTSLSGGVVTLRGAGEDIWGPADEFHYYYRAWSGDGVFIARVTSVEFTFNWAKAGIMLRSDLTTNAQHALAFVSPERNHALVYRTTTGGSTTAPTVPADEFKVMPVWLRLTRDGDRVAMDFSSDGVTWRRRASTTLALPQNVYVGLVVNSHVDATLCTATFDNVSLGDVRPSRLTGIARSPTSALLRWQDNDLDETNFEIERSTDGVTFAPIGSAPAWNPGEFGGLVPSPEVLDTGLSGGTTYHYRVRSASPRGASGYSNVVTVTTPPPAPAGWTSGDIGDTALTGDVRLAGGVFTLRGAGAGVGGVDFVNPGPYNRSNWPYTVSGHSDEFQFCSRPLSGEGQILARLTGLSGSSAAHAGLMVRDGTDPSAFNVFVALRADGRLAVTRRNGSSTDARYLRETSGPTPPPGTFTPPLWLKLVRGNGGVLAYRSTDGVVWEDVGWASIPLPSGVEWGLAVASRSDGGGSPAALATATFDNVTVGPVTTPIAPPSPPTNLHVVESQINYLQIGWTLPGSYDRLEIQRSADGVTFSTISQQTVPPLLDSPLSAETTYYYRARTIRGSMTSAFSPVLAASTRFYPSAPTNLVATAASSTSVRLAWTDTSSNESGFYIYRSTDNVNFIYHVQVPADAASYVVENLAPGTLYYFYVEAAPSRGDASSRSNVATATPGTGPTSPAAPSNLVATALAATQVRLTWTDNAGNESGFSLQRSPDGTTFAEIATFTANATAHTDAAVNPSTTYFYRVRASNGDGTPSAWSNVAQVTTPELSATGWESRDIGAVAAAGSESEGSGTLTLRGSGDDIWNTADEFRYRYQPLTGDGEIITRVTGLTDTHGWAKAGVMFRETLAANSRHVWMCVSSAHGTALQYRAATGGESGSTAPTEAGGVPRWLRLVRAGSEFRGYESVDGTTWTLAGSTTLALPTTIFVGFAVTSHSDGVLCTATFTNSTLVTGGPSTGTPPAPPTGLMATAISDTQVNLSWTDASSNETGFELESSTDNVNYTRVTFTTANTSGYAQGGLLPGTAYFYRVRAVNAAGVSSYSNVANVTTQPGTNPSGTWASQDVGGVGVAGSASETGGVVTLRGSGEDIWNRADEFRFRFQSWTGDGRITARVASLSDTNGWAKAGVMFRATNDGGSAHAFMCVSSAHGTALQYRQTLGGESASTAASEDGGAVRWVRVVRVGNTFTGFASVDGANWIRAGEITLALPGTLQVGLALTSHADGVLGTATFEQVVLDRPDGTGGTVAAPTGLAATAASATRVNLSWADNSDNETGFRIERAAGGGAFGPLASVAANVTVFADTSVTAGTTYTYRVKAFASTTESAPSNLATATPANTSGTSWEFADIGAVGLAGSNSSSGNSITISGAGADVWGAADAFRFVYRAVAGDGVVEAQVSTMQNTHGWAKAGVMIRDSLEPNARNAFAFVTPAQHGVAAQVRAAIGGETTSVAGPARNAPYWVRLTRTGARIDASASADGVTWTNYATFTIALNATAYFGFAVTSHDTTQRCTAVFVDPFVD